MLLFSIEQDPRNPQIRPAQPFTRGPHFLLAGTGGRVAKSDKSVSKAIDLMLANKILYVLILISLCEPSKGFGGHIATRGPRVEQKSSLVTVVSVGFGSAWPFVFRSLARL